MSRTLVISEVFPPRSGGSGRWLWELYRRWPGETGGGAGAGGADGADRAGDCVRVLAGEHPEAAAFDRHSELPIERMPLSFASWGLVGFRNVRAYTAAYRRVAAHVKRHECDQVHCGRILPEGLIAWMLRMRHGVPYACYVHGEELNTASTSRELSFLARRALTGASVLVANSVNTARVLMHQWQVPASQIEIMNPGVDAAGFVPAPRDESVRAGLGWAGRRVILTVGRLQARKGHAKLIAALPAIIKQVPDALYAIVGEGEESEQLEELVKAKGLAGRVQFMGELHEIDLRLCMQQCDLFVLPNVEVAGDFEGFGMVLVEAQACGKPVVAGLSGGTSETMRAGETGRLVNCENVNDLVSDVAELLKDQELSERMGAAGRRLVERKFDWPVLTKVAQAVFAERFGGKVMRKAA